MRTALLIPILLFLAGCPRSAVVPPADADCDTACENLSRLGCPEGSPDAGCASVCTHGKTITDMATSCLAAAKTQDAVRACGTVRCTDGGP